MRVANLKNTKNCLITFLNKFVEQISQVIFSILATEKFYKYHRHIIRQTEISENRDASIFELGLLSWKIF